MRKKAKKAVKPSNKKWAEMDRNLRMREALNDISDHASQAASDGDIFVSASGVLHADFRLYFGSDEEATKSARALRRVTRGLRKKSVVALKSKFAAFNKKY